MLSIYSHTQNLFKYNVSSILRRCLTYSHNLSKNSNSYNINNSIINETKPFNFIKGFTVKGVTVPGRPIYLDMQATTPIDPRVLDEMLPFMMEKYGNPHSNTHDMGREAAIAIEKARKQIADLINADSEDIIFTSGATESNNTAIKGIARYLQRTENKTHILTCKTEHKCILESCKSLEDDGFKVTYFDVTEDGIINLDELNSFIGKNKDDISLVSIMYVNNEIGVIQPIKEIAEICQFHNIRFHSDAAQAVGKIPIDVTKLPGLDIMSISGHKIYGPKGIGALYIRRVPSFPKNHRVRLIPLISGGGQERGIRSGTLSPFLCVGMGKACQISSNVMIKDYEHISSLSDMLYDKITTQIPDVIFNGSRDKKKRYPGNLNFSFECVEGEALLASMNDFCLSTGSACTSDSLEPSYVLQSMGLPDEIAHTSVRFGLGRFTTKNEVDECVRACVKSIERLRNISTLWQMKQEGIDLNTIQWE